VAFYYLFIYVMFFFIFTGSPNWEKYPSYGLFRTIVLIFLDGMHRFIQLTLGIWTDAMVRSYNVIGRVDRYLGDEIGAKTETKLSKVVTLITGKSENKSSQIPPQERLLMIEQVMRLIAFSRAIIWIPLPLCVVVAKFSEGMNQSIIFNFTRKEKVQLRQPFLVRVINWFFSMSQVPLAVAVVCTASAKLTTLLASTLAPLAGIRVITDLIHLVDKLKLALGKIEEGMDELNLSALEQDAGIKTDAH